jgi:UDP-glucuronate 4-epimerase
MNKNIKILITGGAGFIGSHLAQKLASQADVTVFDDFNTYYSPRLKTDNLADIVDKISLVRGDICDLKVTRQLFERSPFNLVIHLAARAGVRPSLKDPVLYSDVNCTGTMNLLELCREFDVKRFFFASSSSVYGNNLKVPFYEDDPVELPISPYAATKRAGELFCANYHALYGIECACLRFFTVYGPRQRPDMAIHKFTRWTDEGKPITVFGDGSTRRNYTYVDDIVEGVRGLLESHKGYAIYNLAGARSILLMDLIHLIGKKLGKIPKVEFHPPQPGDVERTEADISRLQSLTGYCPKVSLEEGVEKYISWYRRQLS